MDYFLHAECGYSWGTTVQGLAPSEKRRLWFGWLIWSAAVENAGRDGTDHGPRSQGQSRGGHLSAGDKKILREMNRRQN